MSQDATRYIDDPAPTLDAEAPPVAAAEAATAAPSAGSLADRMKGRRDALEREQTTILELPDWEGILAAEYKLLSWTKGRKIAAAHRDMEDPDLQVLYSACDYLLAAQTGMFEIKDGEHVPITDSWEDLCERAGVALTASPTPRQAMLALLGDDGAMRHFADYESWKIIRGRRVEEAVMRDFERTE